MKNLVNEVIFNLKRSKNLLLLGGIIFVLGLVLGFILNLNEDIFIIHNDNMYLYYSQVFCSEKIGISLLIKRCLSVLLVLVLVALFSLNKYTIYLNFIVLFYRAFTLGIAGKIFICQIAITGAIMFIFLILVQALFMSISILLFIILIYNYMKKCGDMQINFILKTYLISSIVAIIGCILEFLLIIMLFRPLNLYF